MNIIDQKYIAQLANHLPHFKKKRDHEWNMRCIFCGDSQKKKHKARGYIYLRNDKYFYYCHNCGTSIGIGKLLEHVDPVLFKQWKLEKYRPVINPDTPQTQFRKEVPLKLATNEGIIFKKISSLSPDHPAKRYVDERQIPARFHYKLFYVNKFNQWVNTKIPEKLSDKFDQARLVIPFHDQNKQMFGWQGRLIGTDEGIRYITIMLDHQKPKVFGLDTLDNTHRHYVVEGPIDSMFLPNAIAMAGSDFQSIKEYIDKKHAIIVYDNERRSPQICAKIAHAIDEKYNVCIWPSDLKSKDINKLHLDGYDCKQIIEQNTFNGIAAALRFNNWKRC